MSTHAVTQRRAGAPGLLGWLERELAGFPGLRPFDAERVMRCEEYREPGRFVVRAELPGVDPERDVEVTVEEGLLKIRAHRREEHREHRRTEFFYGEMVRTLLLPAGADETALSATYRDGILEIVVPVPETAPSSTTVPVTRLG